MPGPWDPGLQVERTALAWTRTGLSLTVAVGVVARLTADRLDVLASFVLVVGLPASLWILVASRRCAARGHRSLVGGGALPDGRLIAVTAGLVVLLSTAELAHLVVD